MARALAAGLVHGGIVTPDELLCSSRSEESGRALLQLFNEGGARWVADNAELARQSDVLVFAVKPQQFPETLPSLRDATAGKLVLSLAAGITLQRMIDWLHPEARVVRTMPNTPMQIGAGASVYACGRGVTEADRTLVHRMLAASGRAWAVEESQIDAITALSGSGPAYVFHFIDALTRAAVALDVPEPLARELAVQTVLGSARLAAESELTPMELAAQVKSPRGTTLAGCSILEENDALGSLMARCLAAAKARAGQLARGES
jgi:pyrroline-5-carboxylate reductase